MTSLASNTIPPAQTSTSPASTSNTPSAHSTLPASSGQSSTTIAAATAGSRPSQVSYAQATKKPSLTPPIVASNTGPSPPVVSGAQGTNARTSNASPVNGKTQVAPAVPTVTPAMSNSSVIVNGTSGPSNGHGRKSSIVSGGNGGNAWMQNGNPHTNRQQQNNAAQIQFGSFPANQPGPAPGSLPVNPSSNLTTPAVPTPVISSPQMSSSLPQPAVSGGRPPVQGGRDQSTITFGSLGSNVADRNDQRQMHSRPTTMPIPPVAPASGHARRESASSHQQQHPEMQPGIGPNRGGMPPNGSRRNPGPPYAGQNAYQQQYNNHNNYNNRNTSNQSRGGYPGAMSAPHYSNVQQSYQNSQRPPRSPALPHNVPLVHNSLPGTPQLGTVPIAHSPSFSHVNLYPTAPQHYLPPAQQYDPNMFQAYSQMYNTPYSVPPPASPRNQYTQLPAQYMGMSAMGYPPPMARSSSAAAAADIHRIPSGFGMPVPQQPMSPSTSSTPNSHNSFVKPERVSKGLQIVDPETGKPRDFNMKRQEAPKPRPPVVAQSPLIVSSGTLGPRPSAAETYKKTDEEKRKDGPSLKMQVKMQLEAREKELAEQKKAEEEKLKREAEEAEKKRQQEEEEERKRKEAEELATREAEEAEKKRQEEEEQRIRKEQEEAAAAAAAEAARIEKEKAEEEARLAKEREDEERRIKEEEERRVKEEQEAAERKAKEEAEKLAKEEEGRKAKEQAEAQAAAEAEAAAAKAAAAKLAEEAAAEPAEKSETDKATDSEEPKEQPVSDAQHVDSAQSAPGEDAMRPPTKARGKPSPLVLKTSTEPGPPSAALNALHSARFIGDINSVRYPDNIMSPNPALNAALPAGKFKYQKDFLLQFQNVFTEKPTVDWDKTIRDTVGEPDSARPMTARMPSSGLGNRGSRPSATSAQPPMGSMGSFGTGKFGLAANMLTSAQRFEQSNRTPGAISSNPLQPLAAVGQFRPGPPSISRTNSSQGLSQQGSLPQSPRVRSQRGERGTSKRGNTGAGGVAMERSESKQPDSKPDSTTSASDIKPLIISSTGWRPRTVQAAASTGAQPGALSAVAPPVPSEDNKLPPEMVQRKVKAALNKMTPEKFDKISSQILDIASQSKYETDGRTLRQVIQLTFEKATDEAAWSSMYAKFCKVMMESMDPSIKDESIKDAKTGNVVTGGILFRKYLLNRCQEEFQRGWKVNLPPKPDGEPDEAVMLSDEYYIAAAAKRRGLGLIQFIGELFKLGMLTERIMHECVKKLVDFEGVPEEAEVESLCKLLRTIGASLDATEKSRPMMDAYFQRIQTMIDHPDLQSRLKFMLMDILDARRKGWEINETDKGPKTLAEIQADVAKAAAEKEAISRANAQRGGRPMGTRGDSRNFSQGGYGQSDYQRQMAQNTINSEDLRKLKQRDRAVNSTQSTFGPPSMFGNRGSNPKKMGPPSFNRGDDSGPASRTATPPGTTTSRNSFHILSDMGSHANDGDANDSISPAPSAASSPPLAKASPAMRSLTGKE